MKLHLSVLPILMAVAFLSVTPNQSSANTKESVRRAILGYLTRNTERVGQRLCYAVLESRFRKFHLDKNQKELRAHQDRNIPPTNILPPNEVLGIPFSGHADININIEFRTPIARLQNLPTRLDNEPRFECRTRMNYSLGIQAEYTARGDMRCEVEHQQHDGSSELRCEFRIETSSY